MSEARLMQILASLARRSPLRTLHTICETQHQISTRRLEQYLEPIGDELADFAFYLRQDYDQLHAANQRLEVEVARLREALDSKVPLYEAVERACGSLPDGWKIEIHCEQGAGWVELYDDCGVICDGFPTNNERLDYTVNDAIDAALSTDNGEVTE
ncbi:hypothetical protein [uncultured Pseudomonas sp.]|uniref:hypothetical protein n=1 Tax=uncultured Pseudomonas sp. TaxID=114707 RepID=UPI002638FDA3|nr:hypothetical protein [uncultured Pseudomonas sp.]